MQTITIKKPLLYLTVILLCLPLCVSAQYTEASTMPHIYRISPAEKNPNVSRQVSNIAIDGLRWHTMNYMAFGSLDHFKTKGGVSSWLPRTSFGALKGEHTTYDWWPYYDKYDGAKEFLALRLGFVSAPGGHNYNYTDTWIMSLLKNGNVGIGVKDPTSTFHISKSGTGSAYEIGSQLYQPSIAANNGLAFQIGKSNEQYNAGKLRFIYKGQYSRDNVLSLGFHSKDDIFNVVATGKVGIGTTSPTAKLDVDGVIRIRGGSPGEGRVLTSDVNGLASWQSAGSNSGWVASGTTTLPVTSATGKVGIGTTSPTAKLDVDGVIRIRGGSPGEGRVLTSDANGLASWQSAGSNSGWVASGTTTLPVTSATGKVGIGTTGPTAKLEIKDSDVMVKIRNTNDNGGIQILNSYNAAYFGMYNDSGSAWGAVPANASRNFFAIQNNGKVGSVTNSGGTAASFRNVLDDGTGKMGIGTAEPEEKLDINGNIKIRGAADEKAENKPDIGRVLTCMDAKGTAKWVDMGSHGGGWVAQTRKRRSTGAFDESDEKIVTTDRLVGIGVTNLDLANSNCPLYISKSGTGSAYERGMQLFQPAIAADNGLLLQIGKDDNEYNSGYMRFLYKGNNSVNNALTFGLRTQGNILNLTTSGNVGVGTIEPEEKLDINGNIKIRGTAKVAAPAEGILADIGFNAARSTLGLRIRGSLSPGTNWKSDITFSLIGDTDREAPYKYEFDYLKFSNATQNIIAFKPLLISKSGTGSTVEIGSELYQPAMAVDNALAFQIGRSDDNFNAGSLRFIYKGDKNTNNVLSLGFHSNDDILNVVATGKVGISTSAPLAKFDILGGSDNDGRNGAPMMAFQYRDGGYRHWIKTRHNGVANDNKNAIDFYLNNSTTKDASSAPDPNSGSVHGMSITAVGVGIGTNAPGAKLHVEGGSIKVDNGGLCIREDGATGAEVVIGTASAISRHPKAGWIGTTNNYGLCIGTNDLASNMYLDTDDNVFIGFDNGGAPEVPNAKSKFDLFVHQGILTEDYALAPQSSWSDYVFDKEYQLKKLSEVENFIQKNKHLPNIPSKAEIAKEGYSLHEINVKLLEKIEELTLYAIEQDKEFIEQGKKIVEQEQDIKSLKTQVSHFSQQEERIKALEEKILNQSK